MLKMTPKRKRPDRALDLLEVLKPYGFRLQVVDLPPNQYDWVWNRTDEREYYTALIGRMARLAVSCFVKFSIVIVL